MVNLLFHNFPDQKIVLVAHSNQALNDLFEKIVALDIPERYLLRLGRGIEASLPASMRWNVDKPSARMRQIIVQHIGIHSFASRRRYLFVHFVHAKAITTVLRTLKLN